MDDKLKRRPNEISISRVKTIMKSSPDVENVSQESVFLVTKATELFMRYLVKEAHNVSGNAGTLEYRHVSNLVDSTAHLGFLREIVPRKATLRAVEVYQRRKGLKIERPGSSPTYSEICFSSEDETDHEMDTSNNDNDSSSKAKSPVYPKDTLQASPGLSSQKFSYETFAGTSSALKSSGTSSQTEAGPAPKDKMAEEESLEMDSDADSSTEVSMGKCLGRKEILPSPMSVGSISSGSRTPSPSPSYSSLSPDANSVVHVDAESSNSSDCVIIE